MAAPIAFAVTVTGGDDLQRYFKQINPEIRPQWVERALVDCGLLVQDEAARNQIERGGTHPPLAHRLTSRTGTLRRSIRVDRRNLPRYVDVGSDVAYARVHELGIPPFPKRAYLEPALRKMESRFDEVFSKRWGEVINSAGGVSRFRGRGVPGGDPGSSR